MNKENDCKCNHMGNYDLPQPGASILFINGEHANEEWTVDGYDGDNIRLSYESTHNGVNTFKMINMPYEKFADVYRLEKHVRRDNTWENKKCDCKHDEFHEVDDSPKCRCGECVKNNEKTHNKSVISDIINKFIGGGTESTGAEENNEDECVRLYRGDSIKLKGERLPRFTMDSPYIRPIDFNPVDGTIVNLFTSRWNKMLDGGALYPFEFDNRIFFLKFNSETNRLEVFVNCLGRRLAATAKPHGDDFSFTTGLKISMLKLVSAMAFIYSSESMDMASEIKELSIDLSRKSVSEYVAEMGVGVVEESEKASDKDK